MICSEILVRVVSVLNVSSFIWFSVQTKRYKIMFWSNSQCKKKREMKFLFVWCNLPPSIYMDPNVMLQFWTSKGNSQSLSLQVEVSRWRALVSTQPLENTPARGFRWTVPVSEALMGKKCFYKERRGKRMPASCSQSLQGSMELLVKPQRFYQLSELKTKKNYSNYHHFR